MLSLLVLTLFVMACGHSYVTRGTRVYEHTIVPGGYQHSSMPT